MTDPLVLVLAGGPPVSVFLAVVDSVAVDGTLTLRVAGGLLASVTRLRSYSDPAAGDVVHVLSTGQGTTVVLGAEVARAGVPTPAQPTSPTVAVPSSSATYNRVDQTWTAGSIAQTPGVLAGAFFYPLGALTAVFGQTPSGVEILLRVGDEAVEPLGMVLVKNPGPVGVLTPMSPLHTVQPPVGASWVRLPIAWLPSLVNGLAGGIGFISNTDTVHSVSDGTLRVTPM